MERPITTIGGWALLGRQLRQAEFDELKEIIKRSAETLSPLGEPLAQGFGLNRWLARAREEAYSDWLQWLFQRMNPAELARVLDLPRQLHVSSSSQLSVNREVWLEEGHEGQSGRIDLTILLEQAVVAVEVKKGDADNSDRTKHDGYRKSIERSYPNLRKEFVFIVRNAGFSEDEYGFKVRRYPAFCRNLRRLAMGWIADKQYFQAAMTLMIAATIESNLLGLSGDDGSSMSATSRYLEKFVGEAEYE